MNTTTYRPLILTDVEPAARVIARSFRDDPLIAYMLPFKPTRVATLVKLFRVIGEISINNGRRYGVGNPLQGVAYWKHPNQENMSISAKTLVKFLSVLFTMYPIGYFRGKTILPKIDALHDKYTANQPHYYLDNLGMLPSAQGQGLSSQFLRPILAKADEQHVIAYTDTATRKNVSF